MSSDADRAEVAVVKQPDAYPDMADLVPHGDAIRMLDELVEWRPGRARCSMVVGSDNPFIVGGSMEAVVTLEIMAQAVAACLGYEAFRGGEGVRVGMIVGVRKMTLGCASIEVGDQLSVVAECLRGDDTISRFHCETHREGTVIATASMTVFHASEPPT